MSEKSTLTKKFDGTGWAFCGAMALLYGSAAVEAFRMATSPYPSREYSYYYPYANTPAMIVTEDSHVPADVNFTRNILCINKMADQKKPVCFIPDAPG